MLLLFRSLMSRISIDMDPNHPPTLRAKSASRNSVRIAFRSRDLDLLNAYYDYFSESTGTRLVTLAMTAHRSLPELSGKFSGEAMAIFMFAYDSLKAHENSDRKIADDTIMSVARSMMQYPDRSGDIYIMLVQRGMPNGDITPIVDAMMTGSALAEGAL
jgi:hypothetical protein